MAERLVTVPLFTEEKVSGLAASSFAVSPTVNLTQDVISAKSIIFFVSSVTSTADIGFFFRASPDGQRFGSHSDQAALLTSTKTTATSTGWYLLSMPALLPPYMQVVISGTGSNPTDTRTHAYLVLRMS